MCRIEKLAAATGAHGRFNCARLDMFDVGRRRRWWLLRIVNIAVHRISAQSLFRNFVRNLTKVD
jgi:hypothetical protein